MNNDSPCPPSGTLREGLRLSTGRLRQFTPRDASRPKASPTDTLRERRKAAQPKALVHRVPLSPCPLYPIPDTQYLILKR
ncbi:hypothetical protein [Chlorogloeopsis sp. ULAP02]|uniref:hypothetical protein n=1 Tax=Chlorogloeopsis sp. ULAP02 TaxID=3107926 RepID=UPI003135CCA7